ncbi:MAG: acylphosphatase [Gemmatimonadales bacterium]
MRRRYLVEGDVQGVGFRYFTVRVAQQIGILGWVRNLRDGRVETVGQGTPEQLARFEAALRRGPSPAQVREVQVTNEPDEGDRFTSFEIRWA